MKSPWSKTDCLEELGKVKRRLDLNLSNNLMVIFLDGPQVGSAGVFVTLLIL